MKQPPSRLLLLTLAMVLVCLGALSLPAGAAPADDGFTLSNDGVLNVAVFAAVEARQGARPADLVVANIRYEGAWAFGMATIPAADERPPQTYLFLAQQAADEWDVALETDERFAGWASQAPTGLISDQERATFARLGQGAGPDDASLQGDGSAQLGLPWAVGETWTLTGGPHSGSTAVDFAGGSGQVRSARAGTAYYPCANMVKVYYGDGWASGYYHLINIAVGNGQPVDRGTFLGNISAEYRCGGGATGPHVHFWMIYNDASVSIVGRDIGGWTVEAGAGDYQGCMVKAGNRQCAGSGRIYNDGMVGSGDRPPDGGYTEPAEGAVVSGAVMLRGEAVDDVGVANVNFTANYDGQWRVVCSDNAAPYECYWNLDGIADQAITLGFDVTDTAGNIVYSPRGVRTITKVSLPAAPTGLRVLDNTYNSITIGWSDASANEQGFNIYRWNGSDWAPLASLPAGSTRFTDTGLSYRSGYSYMVRAYNQGGLSGAVTVNGYIATISRDMNLDGRSDILWRHSGTGANMVWFMNGRTIARNSRISAITDTRWQIAGTGDFNNDGRADIVWRHSATGDNAIWFMNGATLSLSVRIPRVSDMRWRIVGTGDFNGDNRSDILWRNSGTGANSIWFMNGRNVSSTSAITMISDTRWQVGGTGDFNGDRRSDIVWRNSGTGDTSIWFMSGPVRKASAAIGRVSTSWRIVGTGDFNGDNRSDILWRNSAGGDNSIWFMNGSKRLAANRPPAVADSSWRVAGVGDYNGDRKADILWRHATAGLNSIWFMSGATRMTSVALPQLSDLRWQIGASGGTGASASSVSPDGVDTDGASTTAGLPAAADGLPVEAASAEMPVELEGLLEMELGAPGEPLAIDGPLSDLPQTAGEYSVYLPQLAAR